MPVILAKTSRASRHIEGVSLNTGIASGRAVFHPSPQNPGNERITEDHSREENIKKLDHALEEMVREIQTLISQHSQLPPSQTSNQREFSEVLDSYLLLARDPGWRRQLREKIHQGLSAIGAVDQTLFAIQKKLSQQEGSIWRERISDFEDLSFRLKRYLTTPQTPQQTQKEDPVIVIAERMGPAELLDYNRQNRLAGLILAEQSQTAHVAIVARSLKIPVIGGIQGISQDVCPGDLLILDGNRGCVHIHPSLETLRDLGMVATASGVGPTSAPLSEGNTNEPVKTRDGIPVSLLLNAGLLEDVDYIQSAGAEGIGLYRTEIPLMIETRFPNIEEQAGLYREIRERAGNYPVVFRTLDIGRDKSLPCLNEDAPLKPREKRQSTFDCLGRPLLLRSQFRALIQAAGNRELSVMLPMIAEVDEIQAARDLLNGEVAREQARGNRVPQKVRLGAMIEVPALVCQLPQVLPHVDFLSVGSNDLFQFFFGIARESARPRRYDVLSPAFLRVLRTIQTQCQAAQVPLSICGEMAGTPLEALALIGLGYTSLSMSASSLPLIKALIRQVSYQEISGYMATACTSGEKSIREELRCFAKDHGIEGV